MSGRVFEAHVLRLAIAVIVLAGWAGLLAGIIRARQEHAGRLVLLKGFSTGRVRDIADRLWLPGLSVLLLLALSETPGPWLTVGAAIVAGVVGRAVGPFLGRLASGRAFRMTLIVVLAAVPLAMFLYIVDAAGFDDWGGFMMNLFLAALSIVLCFPIGVMFALGRRSKLPLVRVVSTLYIEIVRGAPLFVLLLLANVALQFFIPAELAPSTATRSIIVFTFFTAAYMAEIVRGGLQSVPRGQEEAAKALGLSPVKQMGLIILPQALRNVIPAQIGQLISLFKDTTLAGVAMGIFELLTVSTAITAQEAFRGQGLIGETLAFTALMFWVVSYTMSRESQRLEKRLGVGTR
jgi:general L-amino acid transport system permease protein